MSKDNGSVFTPGRKIVLLLAVLGLAAMFFSSLFYRWEHPGLQKAMRQQASEAPQAPGAAGSAPEGMGGMAGMDMEGVRAMIAGLEKRLEENPKDIEALLQLASIRTMRGDKEGAAGFIDRAQAAAGSDKLALMDIAGRWFELERFDKAAQALETILRSEPDEMFAHYNLGLLYKYRLNQPEKAREHLEKVAQGKHDFEDLREQAQKALADG
ncbi:MAG: tetratricopeptide repeat protein [Desulfovibrio sp.]